ncbi:uncharacterized protein J7T54_007975 [Emericellopsis cladophorae]|uniref:F-box domain-containing protein n=1 Tax=Emericellopsis cladophorae TaxID=2686198 RepID=A0A9Q0BHA8_9HYPO|nr:uncharacterized protein J7T54_007975 [Emericellopsis cladophorae]KAI6784881.1 hypothetical protein J7T54_007975 [Emericellopsis cladophorae]
MDSLTSQTACPIKAIPVEILLTITQYLTTPELCSLRLSCKVIEDSIWNSFTEEFFSSKQFMLSPFSLHALIRISQSRLADKIRCLQIGTDQILPLEPNRADMTSASLDRYLQVNNLYAAQVMLLRTGKQVKLLAQAMRNLPNLVKVVVRDFNSANKRRRCSVNTSIRRSYGATTSEMAGAEVSIGAWSIWANTDNFTATVFYSVLSALGEAEVSVKAIEHLSKGKSMNDDSFALDLTISPEILPVLRGFQMFHVSLTLRGDTAPLWASSDPTDPNIKQDNFYHYRHFMAFLQHMPNLRSLRINVHNGDSAEASSLLKWLSLPILAKDPHANLNSLPPGLPSPVNLEKLEALSLGFITAEPKSLFSVIAKFAPRLRKLELWKVSLPLLPRPPTPSPGDPKTSAWEPFIKRLITIPHLHLEEIMIGCMQERGGFLIRLSRRPVLFTDKQAAKHYKGTDWKTFVEKNVIPLIGPSLFQDDASDNNSSDSDESMDEEAHEDSEEEDLEDDE